MASIDRAALRAHVEASQKMTPDESEGASKLAQLMRGNREVTHTKIPGTSIGVVIRMLMGSEKQACLGDANKRFRDLDIPPEMRSYTDFEDELCWQILSRVLRDPDEAGGGEYPVAMARDVDELRDLMTVDERDILMTEFLDLEERVNPDPTLQPEAWHEQIDAVLKKKATNPSNDFIGELLNFGSRALASYLLSTVSPQSNSLTRKSGSSEDSGEQSKNETPQPAQGDQPAVT